MSARASAPPARRPSLPRDGAAWAVAIAGVVLAVLLGFQASEFLWLLDQEGFYSAKQAADVVWLNAAAAVATGVLALALPARLRILAAVPGVLAALALLGATAVLGGKAWAMAVAVLTFACCWELGERALRAIGAPRLAALVPAATLGGVGLLGVLVIAIGRLELLEWWTAGLVVVLGGAVGLARLARLGWARRDTVREAVTGSPLSVAALGILGLLLGWASVYASAPEIMFDAVYGKAWLPEQWAQTGAMEPQLEHPVLNVAGFAQVLATPGHLLGAPAIGRYLALASWVGAVALVWWWGRRHGAVGPLAAVAAGSIPHVMWQATTAYDDLLLATAALAMAAAVVAVLEPAPGERPLRVAIGLGLLAGSCISLKLHLGPLVVVLVLAWALRGGALLTRLGGLALGGLITVGPPMVLRWIDTGNPLLPSYNNIFKSEYWPAVNETWGFPVWDDHGPLGPIEAVWRGIQQPDLMTEAVPPGAFTVLVGAVVLALVLGWRRRDRTTLVLLAAVVAGSLLWWTQLRYLRYLLPTGFVALAVVLVVASPARLGPWGQRIAVGLTVLLGALTLPSTIASYWNVPNRDVPFAAATGRWDARDYEQAAFPEREALAAYDRAAGPDALAYANTHARIFLSGERDLSYHWEVDTRMTLDGPLPTTAGEAQRRWAAVGVRWAVVSGEFRTLEGPGYRPALLREHGEPLYSDRGWTVFRIVDRPARPRPLAACDDRLGGRTAGCWVGLDPSPGLTAAESPTGAVRELPACEGAMLVVDVRAAAGGAPSSVAVDHDGYDPKLGHEVAELAPGGRLRVHATAPPGATKATISLRPGPGATLTEAKVGRLGPGC